MVILLITLKKEKKKVNIRKNTKIFQYQNNLKVLYFCILKQKKKLIESSIFENYFSIFQCNILSEISGFFFCFVKILKFYAIFLLKGKNKWGLLKYGNI